MKPDPNDCEMSTHREPTDREGGFTEISIEISEEEFETTRAMAERQGLTLDEWIADTVRRELDGELDGEVGK